MRSASGLGGTTRPCAAAFCASGVNSAAAASARRSFRRAGMARFMRRFSGSWNPRYRPRAKALEGRESRQAKSAILRCSPRQRAEHLRVTGRIARLNSYALLLRRQRTHIGNDGVEIGVGHLGVILIAHRTIERRAVLAL